MDALARDFDVRFVREHEVGGHFAAMEEPERLVADLRDFFRPQDGLNVCVTSRAQRHGGAAPGLSKLLLTDMVRTGVPEVLL